MSTEERPSKKPRLNDENDGTEKIPLESAAGTSTGALNGQNSEPPVEMETKSLDHAAIQLSDDEEVEVIVEAENPSDISQGAVKPLSKSQQKKLRKMERWEATKKEHRAKLKEKKKAAKARKRAELAANEGNEKLMEAMDKRRQRQKSKLVPVTFIIDCSFNDLMLDQELKSLASQITRIYSDNRNALYRVHIAISSFQTTLKDRFEKVLASQHEHWHGVRFFSEDFVTVAKLAKSWMCKESGGAIEGALKARRIEEPEKGHESLLDGPDNETRESTDTSSLEVTTELSGDVVYLSSESENVITELEPYTTYIIGGLVDRNRHKGICYRRAMDKGVKTARLPIGYFLDMSSRKVLATNHVCEIMLEWLKCGDWGEAFMKVIPKRKGGTLRETLRTNASVEVDGGTVDAACERENDDSLKRAVNVEGPPVAADIHAGAAKIGELATTLGAKSLA